MELRNDILYRILVEHLTRPTNKNRGGHNPVRILLVEDNPAEIHLFRLALNGQNQKCDLHEIRDGAAALQYIEEYRKTCAEEPEPCVIVLDIHLPKHNGPAVLRAIKHEPVLSHVHVAVLTTCASPQEELEVRQLGVSLYREKPADLEKFIQVVQEIVEICHEGSEPSAV
jgi:CheY-like chemotaxis protein